MPNQITRQLTDKPATSIDQSHARATGDVVAGDKIESATIIYEAPRRSPTGGVVEQLLNKLQHEISENVQVMHTVSNLMHFEKGLVEDGIIGLDAKLRSAGREDEILSALEKKEQFAKLLEEWSMYASAQEIFAYLLAQAEYRFRRHVKPLLADADRQDVDDIITNQIVEPTIEQCGASVFVINHSTAMGMFYWLAEQCYVRWHE